MVDAVAHEKIKVQIITSLHHIEGEVTLTAGYRGRVSDMLNDPRLFIPISGVRVHDHSGKLLWESAFLSINKHIIHLVIPIKG